MNDIVKYANGRMGRPVVKDANWWDAVEVKANLDLDSQKRARAIELEKIDFEEELNHWLNMQVETTRKTYSQKIGLFGGWLKANDIDPRFIDRAGAEEFALWLKGECLRRCFSNNWYEIGIKAVRSLYTHLQENVGEGLLFKNHFLKLKIKMAPKSTPNKRAATDKEVQTLIRETDPKTSLAIVIMAGMGLRIGAMECLAFKDNGDGTWDYHTVSKGKEISGPVPTKLALQIRDIMREGFTGGGRLGEVQKGKKNWTEGKVFNTWGYYDTERAKHQIMKVKREHGFNFGSLCHSLRHYSAIKLYKETNDIMAVKDLLNHTQIETTMGYLKRADSLRKLDRYKPAE
ncbi:hypothetical protein FACS189491_06630 [Spirochaetia bacterium]|nr:hypothetical protein FACS189491_06630 [Spirochaetia bacterium]